MGIIAVYRPNTEVERPVTEFIREFTRRTGKQVEHIDPDSPKGTGFITAYGIVEYPTLVATDNEGRVQQMWTGLPLPTISEASYYA